MFGLAHYLIKQLQQSPLLVRYELRVTDNVDEEHIGDLQLDFFFRFSGHPGDDLALRELHNLLLLQVSRVKPEIIAQFCANTW
jgi:hypothetical protein